METWEVVNGLLARGLKIEVKSGMLMVGPRDLMSDETRAIVREYTPGLLAFMAVDGEDVQWRLAAMLAQLLPLSWPCAVPTLCAAPDAQPNKEDCRSCGELLDVGEGNSYCCGACARAKDIALELWMQRPAKNVRAA
jgi:hypothetical protein